MLLHLFALCMLHFGCHTAYMSSILHVYAVVSIFAQVSLVDLLLVRWVPWFWYRGIDSSRARVSTVSGMYMHSRCISLWLDVLYFDSMILFLLWRLYPLILMLLYLPCFILFLPAEFFVLTTPSILLYFQVVGRWHGVSWSMLPAGPTSRVTFEDFYRFLVFYY